MNFFFQIGQVPFVVSEVEKRRWTILEDAKMMNGQNSGLLLTCSERVKGEENRSLLYNFPIASASRGMRGPCVARYYPLSTSWLWSRVLVVVQGTQSFSY